MMWHIINEDTQKEIAVVTDCGFCAVEAILRAVNDNPSTKGYAFTGDASNPRFCDNGNESKRDACAGRLFGC